VALISRNPVDDIGYGETIAFLVSILCVTVRASEIASCKPDKSAWKTGIQGFPLYAVEYFIDDERHFIFLRVVLTIQAELK
jgi:hypothetical protein